MGIENALDFIEGDDVHGLDVVFKAGHLVFQIVHHYFIVFNYTSNLQLFDSISKEVKHEDNGVVTLSIWSLNMGVMKRQKKMYYVPYSDEFTGAPK